MSKARAEWKYREGLLTPLDRASDRASWKRWCLAGSQRMEL